MFLNLSFGGGHIMEVRNCVRCGRLFQYVSGPPICNVCKQKEEESFQLVKEYIYEHKNANMIEVSNETGVSVKLIERFLREGRLVLTEDSPIYLKCENCGKEIKTGRFCQACSMNLSNEMRMSTRAEEVPSNRVESADKNKMRFLNRENLKQ